MYAGLKKLTAEWLSGYAMSSLSRHWVLSPFRWVLTEELTDLLIVHWFTAIFDFSIAFLMTCGKTRVLATPFMIDREHGCEYITRYCRNNHIYCKGCMKIGHPGYAMYLWPLDRIHI